MSKKVNKTELVREIMTRNPNTRNNDLELIAEFWKTENHNLCKFASTATFLREFTAGKITMPETITRIGRLVQQTYPELSRDASFVDRRKRKIFSHEQ